MLLKLLSSQDKSDFLAIAELLSLCDKPLLWDGKKIEDITPQTNLDNVSIQKSKKQPIQIPKLKSDYNGFGGFAEAFGDIFEDVFGNSRIESRLLEKIKTIPLQKTQEPAVRLEVSAKILRELLAGKKTELPSIPKLMLFELMQAALTDGNISSIKFQLLNEFKLHYKLEDYVFDELLERAEVTIREKNKTITIIFE